MVVIVLSIVQQTALCAIFKRVHVMGARTLREILPYFRCVSYPIIYALIGVESTLFERRTATKFTRKMRAIRKND